MAAEAGGAAEEGSSVASRLVFFSPRPFPFPSSPLPPHLFLLFRSRPSETPETFTIIPDAIPPIDILTSLPDGFFEALASTKWKERLDALTAVNEKLKVCPNLIDGDFTNLLTAIAKRILSDANVNVVTAAAGSVEGLARGLGKKFGKNRGLVMMSLMERLKERKASVTDALGGALDAVFASVSF